MQSIPNIDGLRLKLVVLLLISALIPMVLAGIISVKEMNRATEDVQEGLTNLSTSTLNRSALVFATAEDTDQVQLAITKASQYDAIFLRIKSQSEIIANSTTSPVYQNLSCGLPLGVWIAPNGGNVTFSDLSPAKDLCLAARILQIVVDDEKLVHQGYIGTSDGTFISWPPLNRELEKVSPFDPREKPFYSEAKRAGRTVWTRPHPDLASGSSAITCATPIYRDGGLYGVVGMDVSLWAISGDLASMLGRGYPFVVDGDGDIIIRPRMDSGNVRWTELLVKGVSDVDNQGLRSVLNNMISGKTGSSVVGLKRGDCYIAYAPITSAGWSLGIAFPAEKMQLPASYIEAGVREVARNATKELDYAVRTVEVSILGAILLTGLALLASGIYVGQRISRPLNKFIEAVDSMGKGDLDFRADGEAGDLDRALSRMGRDLRARMEQVEEDAFSRGMAERDEAISKEIRHKIDTVRMPRVDGYQIATFSLSGGSDGFDFYDVLDIGDERVALEIAHVSGERVGAAVIAALSRPMIRALSRGYQDPAMALREANLEMSENARGPVACFLGVLDPCDQTIEYVNAGHTPPFVVGSDGLVDTLGGGGIALGAMERIDLISEVRTVDPGDVLVMYTDGVTDSGNGSGKKFGIERLIKVVKENRQLPASDLLGMVEAEMRSHMRGSQQEIDSTMIIVKRVEEL